MIYIYIYIIIIIIIIVLRQIVSLYHNSSVWLNTRDAPSQDRNTPNSLKPFENEIKENGWLVSLFNGISTFVVYLMPKLFSSKNSSGTI